VRPRKDEMNNPSPLKFAFCSGVEARQKLQEARNAGIEAIEVPAWEGSSAQTKERIRLIQSTAREFGLEVISVHAGWDALDGLRPTETPKLIRRDLEFAAAIGARILVIHYSVFADPERLIMDKTGRPQAALTVDRDLEERPLKMLERIREGLAGYLEIATNLGVTIALETDVNNSDRLLEFIADTNPQTCGICFDTGHAQIDSNAVELAELLGPRVIHTHLNDNDGKEDMHLLPFQGVVDWPGVLKALAKTGYSGYFAFEVMGHSPLGLAESKHRLQGIWLACARDHVAR